MSSPKPLKHAETFHTGSRPTRTPGKRGAPTSGAQPIHAAGHAHASLDKLTSARRVRLTPARASGVKGGLKAWPVRALGAIRSHVDRLPLRVTLVMVLVAAQAFMLWLESLVQ